MNIAQQLAKLFSIPSSEFQNDQLTEEIKSNFEKYLSQIGYYNSEISTYECYIQMLDHFPEMGMNWIYNPNHKYRIHQIAFYPNPRCGGWFTVIAIINNKRILALFEKWGKRQLEQNQHKENYQDTSIQNSIKCLHNKQTLLIKPEIFLSEKPKSSIADWIIQSNKTINRRILEDPVEYKYNESDPDADWDDTDDDCDLYIMDAEEAAEYFGEFDDIFD